MIHESKIFYFGLTFLLLSCASEKSEPAESDISQGTPVTVVTVSKTTLDETIELNAVSAFLLKTPVKSPATGYLKNVRIKEGDFVRSGQLLMSLQTKEARNLGNTINELDTSFHFRGEINITAGSDGNISQVNFQSGDYVQDGEQIATISDEKSFAFILQLPYELTPLLQANKNMELLLPDSSILLGTVEKAMPAVDAASQTQSYLIAVHADKMIPENLIAKVRLVKASKQNAISIPKEALLTDETQNIFWVMKLINDSQAVRIPVKKGIETIDKVEIIAPQFSEKDRILSSGNFGLPDTATVQIKK